MKPVVLEDQSRQVKVLDEATKAAIEEGRAAIRRGEVVPLEQALRRANMQRQTGRKSQNA